MEEFRDNQHGSVVRKRKYTLAEFDENQREYRFKVKTETAMLEKYGELNGSIQ